MIALAPLIAVLVILMAACDANDRNKPVENTTATESQTATSDQDNEAGDDDVTAGQPAPQLPPYEEWEGILERLNTMLHPSDEHYENRTGSDGQTKLVSLNWNEDNIHLVKRASDTLILASLGRNYPHQDKSVCGYIDLVAAKYSRGKIVIIDSMTHVESGEFGKYNHVEDYTFFRSIEPLNAYDVGGMGITRFGKNTWGWIVGDYRNNDGHELHTARMYALVGKKIQHLGSVKVGESTALKRTGDNTSFSAYNSSIVVTNDEHPTISDLSIIWFESPNGRDTHKRVTFHPYVPGKGYDFAGLER